MTKHICEGQRSQLPPSPRPALWVPSLYPLGHLTRPGSLILTPALDLRQPVNGG